ncbi:trypsin-like peptidase domain-containing protein [Streptomyces diastatochromogenes]|uniref:nSTAND1 domain-containing NTPase n=1 Tax=Streptomyces diastatochromogenes TaxID=42236 RepID=UPI003660B6CF
MPSDLPTAVAQILGPDGSVAGAGFLVAEDVLVTCAHVVRAAGSGPGERVRLAFPRAAGADGLEGHVEGWSPPEGEDVAFVRLSEVPPGTRVLPLGSAAGCGGHRVRSFGFPAQAPRDGHWGVGDVADLLPASPGRGTYLQLTDANDLTTGFSGGPVLDEVTGLVIGMVTEITAPDAFARGLGIAYVTPTEVLREIRPELATQEVCPYRGLEPFTAEHARWFQGRGNAVGQVLANLASEQRLTLLLGPSGSGKSSLIQAGVLRALAEGEVPGSDRWLPVLARPRQDLPAEIESAGLPGAARDGITAAVNRRLGNEPGYQRVLLVIDQFEELLVHSADGRLQDFLRVIDDITTVADAYTKLSVILVMRDDFYPQLAAQAPRLLEAATPGLLNVPGTLSKEELHDIIVLPAQDVGLRFQPGLPEQIISDVLECSPEAAAIRQAPVTVLPLLEMTLSQLWLRRQDGYLTHEAYHRIGGVSGSVTTWCDSALEELPPEQRIIAQRALTSLVHPADPSHHVTAVRAQVPLDELRDLAADPDQAPGDEEAAVDHVIAALAGHRIITTQILRSPPQPGASPGEPVAELIHEALIRDWGALRKWVDQDHRFQEWLDHTRERQACWVTERNPGDLLGGTALAEGLDWARRRRLPGDIATFLAASKQRQQAAARRSRRLNVLLTGLLVVALVAGGGAFWQWRTVVAEREAALSRQLAAQSYTLLAANPELAELLTVQAYRTSHTPESVAMLRTMASLPGNRRLLGHASLVDSVGFSPHGDLLATAGADKEVRLWDLTAREPKPTRTLSGHTGQVNAVVFSPDRHTVATASNDGTVRLWDITVATRTPRALAGHSGQVRSVAFSPHGDILATANADHTAQLWNVATGKLLRTLKGHTDQVRSVAFSPDGDTLATASADTTARLWNVADGRPRATLTGHTSWVNSVAFSPDGTTLATASADNTAFLWNVATGTPRALIGHVSTVESVAFSPDGHTLATASTDHTARLWDVATGSALTTMIGNTAEVYWVAFSPDGHTLATAGGDHTARLWKLPGGEHRTALTGHTDWVWSAAFSPDSKTLATASGDKTARLWDVKTRKPGPALKGRHDDQVFAVAFSPHGDTLATASADSTVQLWDVASGKRRGTLKGHTGPVYAVAFSPNGRFVATGGADNYVGLWDLTTGKHQMLLGHDGEVRAVAFNRKGDTLATAGTDKTVRLWDVGTSATSKVLYGHTDVVNSVAFSPDGRTLATGSSDFTARLWDVADGNVRATLTGNTNFVNSVAFSPDGDTLATAADSFVRLWNVADGTLRATEVGHGSWVLSATYSPNGRLLASTGADNTARLWDAKMSPASAAITTVCGTVHRGLTSAERIAYLPGRSVGEVCPDRP